MDSETLFQLLNDQNKEISNWDSLFTYFSKRLNSGDLNGLYTLVLMSYEKAKNDSQFDLLDYIHFEFFLSTILEYENVEWRAKRHLMNIKAFLKDIIESETIEISIDELSKFYFELGTHFEKTSLIKEAISSFSKAKEYFLSNDELLDASYCEQKIIEDTFLLPKEERCFPSKTELHKIYKEAAKGPIEALSGRAIFKKDPVEQTPLFLSIINEVEEEIVRNYGVISKENTELYIKIKKEILKSKGIIWKPSFELN